MLLPKKNYSHGPAREAGAELGFVSTPHTIFYLIKITIFPVSGKGKVNIGEVTGQK